MRVTDFAQMAVVMGVGVLLAAPAGAETAAEINAGVEAARDACAANVAGCEAAAEDEHLGCGGHGFSPSIARDRPIVHPARHGHIGVNHRA